MTRHLPPALALPLALALALQDEQEPPPQKTAETSETPESAEQAIPPARRPAATAEWGRWERLGSTRFSPDGRWLAYQVRRVDGSGDLLLRVLATDSTETFEEGGNPVFSADGKWLAFSIGHSEEQREALEEEKEPVENGLGLFDLVTGDQQEVERVSSFRFSEDGRFLAMRRYAEKDDEHGADLVLRELASGSDTHFGRVGEFAWSEAGPLLAMTVDAPDQAGNGVRVYDAAKGILRTLDSAEADYLRLVWREDAADLAVLREKEFEEDEDTTHAVLAWRGLDRDAPRTTTYDPLEDEAFPEDLRVVEFAGLTWSDDGQALFFGLKPWETRPAELDQEDDQEDEDERDEGEEGETPPTDEGESDDDDAEEGDADEGDADEDEGEEEEEDEDDAPRKTLRESLDDPPGVEVWHTKDIDILPRQKRTAERDERESSLATLRLDQGRLVRLADELLESLTLLEKQRWALGSDETPYEEEQRFSATVVDLYAVDARTGERERILERVKYRFTGDPRGTRLLFVRDGQIWAYDLEARRATDLTGSVDRTFINQELSSLTDEKPPYGVVAWTKAGERVILNSRYDLWAFTLDGSRAERLTQGAEERIRHRRMVVDPDPDDEEFVDPARGFYVSLYGDTTKKSGYGRLRIGALLERLIWKDASLSRLAKADDAEVYAFVEERFDDSPDLFVCGADLADAKRVSETNPFQSDFLWGHSELVDYENANGEALQGALFYPAGWEQGKRYPMIVYIYELRSQVLHRYQAPSERSPYNTSVYTSRGYFVFQPDIVYRVQNPGLSAVECVVPAVRRVLETGMIDPDRVGLVGHSWGGYQTAFLVTQTDVFAAGVAGAPLTNMMSMSMSIYWNSGQTDAWIFHESQGRMDRPFWRDLDTYIANSPVFNIERLTTPLLVTFGDEDGAVDWHQGIEMYNAARLAQKPLVMLVYPGENHGLREKPNQVDYHHRVLEWFDHYLSGEPAPKWIAEGQTWLDRKRELEDFEKSRGKGKGKEKGKGKRGRGPEDGDGD